MTFRCGGKAVIARCLNSGMTPGAINVAFVNDLHDYYYWPDGLQNRHENRILDIVFLYSPLNDAERLAEIAKIITKIDERGTTYEGDMPLLREILALAEGRSHD